MPSLSTLALPAAALFVGFVLGAATRDQTLIVETSFHPSAKAASAPLEGARLVRRTQGGAIQRGEPYRDRAHIEEVLVTANWPRFMLDEATRIAGCESGWDPLAIGSEGEIGLFQIHSVHAWRVPSKGDLWEPVTNAQVALEIWRTEGWAPWSCASSLAGA